MKPRERAGQDSMARAAPAGHSAPIPMPSSARKRNKNAKVGEKPAMKLQSEDQAMEIISGVFRPIRSAIQPAAVAPTRRSHNVIVITAATAVKETSNSLAIGTMISRKIVKSNASSVQPSQAAIQAFHCSLLGSFHQGISEDELSMADMARSVACRLFKKEIAGRLESGTQTGEDEEDESRWRAKRDGSLPRERARRRQQPGPAQ